MKLRILFPITMAALGPWLTTAVSPVHSASTTRENPQAESPWGAPVDGVQARLRAAQTNWNAGATPRLYVDVRNQGTRHLQVQKQMHGCEVELDGQWFRLANTRATAARPSPFPPGRQYDNLVINLDAYWVSPAQAGDPRTLNRMMRIKDQLTPGQHTVRVAVNATADKSDPGKPVRAVTNPVEIEIGVNL